MIRKPFRPQLAFIAAFILFFSMSCNSKKQQKQDQNEIRIPVIFDTDANNEIDDQHALAYLVFNADFFDIRGITVNATHGGGEIINHYEEAERVLKMCTVKEKTPLFSGANGNFMEIKDSVGEAEFDGYKAVDFIIDEARKDRDRKLLLLPVGKLTNIALALLKAPDIKEKVRIVWLGSNYPESGEYNQDNDIPSLNYILNQEVEFEMVTVRYGLATGSAAVSVTPAHMETNMPGAGPLSEPIEGRHGESFTHFGDYSINLFQHIELYGNPPSRSLFDVVAVAIAKNPDWGEASTIPAPIMDIENNVWIHRPENKHTITIWENFNKPAILDEFFSTMKQPTI